MKSKPPTKKAKLEGGAATPVMQNSEGKPKAKVLSAIKQEQAAAAAASLGRASAGTSGLTSNIASLNDPSSRATGQHRLSYPVLHSRSLLEYPKIAYFSQEDGKEQGEDGSKINSIPIDDVDLLQSELETILSTIALNTRYIGTESDILDSQLSGGPSSMMASLFGEHYDLQHQEKLNTVKSIIESGHGTRTSVSAAAKLVLGTPDQSKSGLLSIPSTSSVVVGSNRKSNNSAAAGTMVSVPSPSARQPKKKLKAELGDKSKFGGNKPARAGQNRSHSVTMDESFLRLEAPNQFWEFADSYCRDITQGDVDILEKELAEFREIPDSVFSIPPLGKHYSGTDKKPSPEMNGNSSKPKEDKERGNDVMGPLTQRLVSALVEDRISQYTVQTGNNPNGTREELNGGASTGGGEFHLIPRPGLVKALGLDITGAGAQTPLESRLKIVLAEQGYLLGEEEEQPINQDDEVFTEIKRTMNTLTKLHKFNLDKMEKLVADAKKEMTRIPYKKQLENADKDILSAYRLLSACKIKRKPITQKERSAATKALQYRQHVLEQLMDVSPSPTSEKSSNATHAIRTD